MTNYLPVFVIILSIGYFITSICYFIKIDRKNYGFVQRVEGAKMNTEREIKPCPFCGSEVYIENIADDSDDTYYMVQCKNDDKCGASSCFGECTKKEVIERWNNRAGAITVNNFGNGEQIKNEGHMTINIGGKNGS